MGRGKRKRNQQSSNQNTTSDELMICAHCSKEYTEHPFAHWKSNHRLQERDLITERVREIHKSVPRLQRAMKVGHRVEAALACAQALDALNNIHKILMLGIAAETYEAPAPASDTTIQESKPAEETPPVAVSATPTNVNLESTTPNSSTEAEPVGVGAPPFE